MKRCIGALSVLGALAWATGVQAEIPIQDGIYRLCNHPAGNAAPPPYGLRLDGLNGNRTNTFTFDFEHEEGGMRSDMRLELNQSAGTIRIFGTVFGGLNNPSSPNNYDNSTTNDQVGWWSVDFTYDMGVGTAPNDNRGFTDVVVDDSAQMQNSGTITRLSGFGTTTLNQSYTLVDKANGEFTFHFGDTSNGNGFRGYRGLSGWGWLIHNGRPEFTPNSDWQFIAKPIPLPGAHLLGMLGLVTFGLLRRKVS